MRTILISVAALACGAALAGCNIIFGIQPAESSSAAGSAGAAGAGTAGAAASGGSVSSGASAGSGPGGSMAGAAGTGASAGSGGAADCPPEKVPQCHPMGGGGGICDPIQLSEMDMGYTIGLVVVGDYLHWANGSGQVVRVLYDGTMEGAYGDGSDSVALAADQDNIYYTDFYDEKIRAVALTPDHKLYDVSSMLGMAPDVPTSFMGHIAAHAGYVYWSGQMPNAVWSAKADGSQVYATKVADKVDDSTKLEQSIGVAVDDSHVYWSDAGKVRRLALDKIGDASSIEDFAESAGAGAIQLDDTRVYWAGETGISQQNKDGSGAITWPAPGDRARGIHLDGDWVYWAGEGGRVLRGKKGGGMDTVVVVAMGPPGAYAVASDCGAIYWSTFSFSHGTAFKVRKPD